MSGDKASLMASLTAELGGGSVSAGNPPEQDLFGGIPIDDPPPAAAAAPFPTPTQVKEASDASVYQDPMPSSGMQERLGVTQPDQQLLPRAPNLHMMNSTHAQQQPAEMNFPFPQPPQTMANAPNITYADPSTNTKNQNQGQIAQSQPIFLSSLKSLPGAAPPPPTSMAKSLLVTSGLLGVAGASNDEKKADSGGGGGLFDDVDQEEEKKAWAVSAVGAGIKRQEAEQNHEQRRLQQPEKQYSLEARMQEMHVNSRTNLHQFHQEINYATMKQGQMDQPGKRMVQQRNTVRQPVLEQSGQEGKRNMLRHQQNFVAAPPTIQQHQPGQPDLSQMIHQHAQVKRQLQTVQHDVVNRSKVQGSSQVSIPGIMYRQYSGEIKINTNANQMGPQAPPQTDQPMACQHQPHTSTLNRYYAPATPGVATAGMHNAPSPQQNTSSHSMQQQQHTPLQPIQITQPLEVPTYYGKVTVNDPMLLQAPSGFLGMVSSPPHWSYQFTTKIRGQPASVWIVRRRFRHVVALEDRVRAECPGAILPPRPDKHVSRALEEASAHQSAEFAWQRAAELERYLNALAVHPEVFGTQSLKMFLGLQDDMGTAWPEVSGNAFTRMSAMGSSAAANLSTSGVGLFGTAAPAATTPNQSTGVMSGVMGSVANSVGVGELAEAATEESAELLALSSSESVRMGAVLQAVPKLEGAVTLLREQGEGAGAVGMELNRLAKEVLAQGDRELSIPLEIFSAGLLRYGRRTKRLGQEIGQATMTAFQLQYKLCRYEKLAWGDRRNALAKRLKERGKADKRAQQLMHQQQQYPPRGSGYGGAYGGQLHMNQQLNGGKHMDRIVSNATMGDNMAAQAVRQCDEIGERLKREVNRVSFSRRMDWAKSMKVIASYMKEAASERVAIWESTRDTFLQTFPDYNNDKSDTPQWMNFSPTRPMPQIQQQMGINFLARPGSMEQSHQQSFQLLQPQANSMMTRSAMGTNINGQAPTGSVYNRR